ncbi:hypothetical protein N7520_004481 [Penicillium odoratum]|uniref:uncharacterized protein n=1 Tax=Penicillium odoratum TaxID=1167516 RepID=UPI002547CAA8|nr:uncharacterized protein N7520_004481 [Penicillium odoratum]KAJ5764922.1 hypothetical protein N7520_004481 [Penicillium odoratum]
MSGLEAVGTVASILQIADLGMKLSLKLCSFYRTAKAANQSMQGLSRDVALTCVILQELGCVLDQDNEGPVTSRSAFDTAQNVIAECKSVFKEIHTAVDKHERRNEEYGLLRRAKKITFAFLGPDIEALKMNLERLKSTMLLMLNVIIYAGQVRGNTTKTTLETQRALIESLLEDRDEAEAELKNASLNLGTEAITNVCDISRKTLEPKETGREEKPRTRELEDYYSLIKKMLEDIDRSEHLLEQKRHLRIRNGVVKVHCNEVNLFQQLHEAEDMQRFREPCFQFKEINFSSSFNPPNQAASSRSTDHAIIRSETSRRPPSPESALENKAKTLETERSDFMQDTLQGIDHLKAHFKSLGLKRKKKHSLGPPGSSPPSNRSSGTFHLSPDMNQHLGKPKYTIGRTNPSPTPHPPPESDIVGYRPNRNTLDSLVLQWTNLTYDELQKANGGIKGTYTIIP